MDGRDTYKLLKSEKAVDVIFGVSVFGNVQVGDQTVLSLAKDY